MPPGVVLRDVYDNVPGDPRLENEPWGFAVVVEGPGGTTLFDTGGSGEVLLENMAVVGFDPARVDRVFLSHVHGDHTNGLDAFLRRRGDVTVFAPVSFPADFERRVRSAGGRFVSVREPAEIAEGLRSTGELEGPVNEQSLIIESPRGCILLTGCAHPGIVAVVARACELAGEAPYLVAGGFHLEESRGSAVERISDTLRALGVRKLAASHCTGAQAIEFFRDRWGADYVELGCGASITVE